MPAPDIWAGIAAGVPGRIAGGVSWENDVPVTVARLLHLARRWDNKPGKADDRTATKGNAGERSLAARQRRICGSLCHTCDSRLPARSPLRDAAAYRLP